MLFNHNIYSVTFRIFKDTTLRTSISIQEGIFSKNNVAHVSVPEDYRPHDRIFSFARELGVIIVSHGIYAALGFFVCFFLKKISLSRPLLKQRILI